MPPSILLTIDVEDWFQVENFKQYIPFSIWSSYEFRVEKNTHHLLDLFDSYNPQPTTDTHINCVVLSSSSAGLPNVFPILSAKYKEEATKLHPTDFITTSVIKTQTTG